MNPARWARIKEAFNAALELTEPERARFLAEACGTDDELRAEVDSLLAAHARENAVLDRPAADYVGAGAVGADPRRWTGRRLGAWEIIDLIGVGGMGEVYRARRVDAEYEKEVAIKLVPAGLQAGFVLQRLRNERQILAHLEHPNIARLIDGGATEEGIPYLVMELVDGIPIDRYVAGRPIAERLKLFCEVCAAVSYAHQRLVVHRDLKPSNILVAADGAVKLLDFGIAKIVQPGASDAAPAATLMQTFTPGFASPEQVLGRPITTASDVYSLGVLLHLLLTGRSPYRGRLDNTQDALREICEAEPAPPGVSGDLDAITLRALRKEPDRRYASVDELARDIQRHLQGRPVMARGDHFSYRARRFLRRHRLEAVAAGLVLFALIGGVVMSMREARIAEAQRARAERHFQSVRKLADTFMFRVHDAIEPLPGSTEAREILVSTSLEYLNTLAAEAGGDPGLQLDLARAYSKIASIQGQAFVANLGRVPEAIASFDRSNELAEQLLAAEPDNLEARNLLASNLLYMSRTLLRAGDTKRGPESSARAVALCTELAQDQDPKSLAKLAQAHMVHSIVLDYTNDAAGAREQGARALGILESLRARFPGDAEITRDLSSAYSTAGSTLLGVQVDLPGLDEALALHRKALALDQAFYGDSPQSYDANRSLLGDHINILNLSVVRGDFPEADTHCRKAREYSARLAADQKNAQQAQDNAQLEGHCARARRGLGDMAEAERLASSCIATLTPLLEKGEDLQAQYTLGSCEEVQASVHEHRAEWQRAQELYASAIERIEAVAAVVTIDFTDREPLERARAGLARAQHALRGKHRQADAARSHAAEGDESAR
jgi:tetratricopeptide (TPR) repeat protein